jgi:restriction system protein
MARRKKKNPRKSQGSGFGLAVFLIAVAALSMDEHRLWVVPVFVFIVLFWIAKVVRKHKLASTISQIDAMSGAEFEQFLVQLFRKLGYQARHVGSSGDFGADLILEKDGVQVAVQAKNYESGRVGNDAVQQAIAGATYHRCEEAMVVTNALFTHAAREQAEKSDIRVVLWDRRTLEQILNRG